MMQPKRLVAIVSDTKDIATRYRGTLAKDLESNGYSVVLCSVFDFLRYPARYRYSIRVFSNLRTNVISCILCRDTGRNVRILNGYGRYKGKRRLRILVSHLLAQKKRDPLLVQNSTDYRYLRRFYRIEKMHYLPGSGGVSRAFANNGRYGLVSRDSKIKVQVSSIGELSSFNRSLKPVVAVGVSQNQDLDLDLCGRVAQSDIFKRFEFLIVPDGYGEGFPHVLADAIASNMKFVISRKSLRDFGLVGQVIVHANAAASVKASVKDDYRYRYCREFNSRSVINIVGQIPF